MNRNLLKRSLFITSIGTAGFFFGVYFEQKTKWFNNFNSCTLRNYSINSKNDLSPFGSVSAAVAISTDKNLSPSSGRVSQIMKHGFPGFDNIRSYDDFVLSYDRRTRVANWVFEHLTKESVTYNPDVNRSDFNFTPDESIHKYFRADNTDYFKTGYDRGHLAAAGNHKSNQKHCEQTFILTNIAPQIGKGFNRDSWNRLERYVRKLTKKNLNVYCCTGPLYLPKIEADGKKYVKYEVIGSNSVSVPTHFFKIILMETNLNEFEIEAYVMPNQVIDNETPLEVFQVPLESIERSSGLIFFDRIDRKQIKKINGKKIK